MGLSLDMKKEKLKKKNNSNTTESSHIQKG